MSAPNEYRPQRPRTSSMLSWGSHKSKDSAPKIDLTENERDKAQRRIKGKADPSVAINEIQPAMQAQEQSTLTPLRSMQFKDSKGDVITDPDRSNPTRPRMERPLDTIRSFEAAIDSGYSRRYSTPPDMQSRRSSFHQGYASPQPRTPNYNPYFERQPESRPESIYDQPQPNGAYGGTPGPNGNPQFRRMQHNRMHSEPAYNAHPHARQHAYQQSYDNSTASSSGTYQTEQGTANTEFSSYNGSNGDLNQPGYYTKPEPPVPQEIYGVDFSGDQNDEYAQRLTPMGAPPVPAHSGYGSNGMPAVGRSYGNQGDFSSPPPPPPPHQNGSRGTLRKPVNQGGFQGSPANGYNPQSSERPKTEKRKSWLSRRFSRQG